ncbi:hypothetical protein EIP86_001127 [Pleurotus ostreatoroseus]|nr:hypothetical protein EIP86_001127 [Pleurotus ostreatoroseus]
MVGWYIVRGGRAGKRRFAARRGWPPRRPHSNRACARSASASTTVRPSAIKGSLPTRTRTSYTPYPPPLATEAPARTLASQRPALPLRPLALTLLARLFLQQHLLPLVRPGLPASLAAPSSLLARALPEALLLASFCLWVRAVWLVARVVFGVGTWAVGVLGTGVRADVTRAIRKNIGRRPVNFGIELGKVRERMTMAFLAGAGTIAPFHTTAAAATHSPASTSPTLPSAAAAPLVRKPTPTTRPHAAPRPITRAPRLWFADGNVVLLAARTAFRVHRGQLARHSEVFADLFELPQPQIDSDDNEDERAGREWDGAWDGRGRVEGCAVVELHDDPAELACLLRALYDGLYLAPPNARHFPTLRAVLRLSTKYLIPHLRAHAINTLSADWPSTLAGWDAREKGAVDEKGRYAPREACAHPILVIELAREMGVREWLPGAFYDLARYGPRRIVSGAVRAELGMDGAEQDREEGAEEGEGEGEGSGKEKGNGKGKEKGKMVYLGRADLHTILLGREAGQRFLSSFIASELSSRPPSAACAHAQAASTTSSSTSPSADPSRACRDSTYYVHLNVLRAVGGITHGRDADALFTLAQIVEMLGRTDFTDGVRRCGLRICCACRRELEDVVRGAREKVWGMLPGWFGLEGEAGVGGEGGEGGVGGERGVE